MISAAAAEPARQFVHGSADVACQHCQRLFRRHSAGESARQFNAATELQHFALSSSQSQMYHFGHLQPKKNLVLYHHIAAHMGQVLDNKLSNDDRARSSGCIVLAPVLPSGDLLKLRAHFSCESQTSECV